MLLSAKVRDCRSVAATEEDKKITEHFRTWNIESTDPTKVRMWFDSWPSVMNEIREILDCKVCLPHSRTVRVDQLLKC